MNAITPEVMDREFIRDKDKDYNINLKKVETHQTYNKTYIDRSNTNNSRRTTINNNKGTGFFKFILEIIFLPVILIYKGIRYTIIKYELKDNYDKFKQIEKDHKSKSKILKKVYNLNKFNDEIF